MLHLLLAALALTASANCPAECDSSNWQDVLPKFQEVCTQCVNDMGWCGTSFCNGGWNCKKCTDIPSTPHDVCPEGYDDWVDTDFFGNDVGTCGQYDTVEEIAQACTDIDECMGFSVLDEEVNWRDGIGPWCMKSNVGSSKFTPDHHFCMKSSSEGGFGTPAPVVMWDPTPYPTTWGGGWGSGDWDTTPAPSVSVVCPKGFTDEPNTDYHGYDIGPCGTTKTMKKAGERCMSDNNCLGFSVVDEDPDWTDQLSVGDPWCFKSVADDTNKRSRTNHHFCRRDNPPQGEFTPAPLDQNVVDVDCPAPYENMPNTDFIGNDISCGEYKTMEKAKKACDEDVTCKGFSVLDETEGDKEAGLPWCLKFDVSFQSDDVDDHHFCMKPGMGPSTPAPLAELYCPQGFTSEPKMDYHGFDIGGCGVYDTVEEAGQACKDMSNCQGFSVLDNHSYGDTGHGDPWCLKHVANDTNSNPRDDHHFCRKNMIDNCTGLDKKACKKTSGCHYNKKQGKICERVDIDNTCHDPQYDGMKFKGKSNKSSGGKSKDNCGCAAMCVGDVAWNFDPKKGRCTCLKTTKSKRGVLKTSRKSGYQGNTV